MTNFVEAKLEDKDDDQTTPLENWQWYAHDTTIDWRTKTLEELMQRVGADKQPEDVQTKIRETAMILLALDVEEGETDE